MVYKDAPHAFHADYRPSYRKETASDGFKRALDWFKAHGGLTRANGDHFRKTLLSRGGSRDALELFREFAGHEPQIGPLLEKRGLTVAQ